MHNLSKQQPSARTALSEDRIEDNRIGIFVSAKFSFGFGRYKEWCLGKLKA
jgi:hypothetical protein